MPDISAIFVRKQIDAAIGLPDKEALYASVGLTEAEAREAGALVSTGDYFPC